MNRELKIKCNCAEHINCSIGDRKPLCYNCGLEIEKDGKN